LSFTADRLGWFSQLFACLGAGMVVERMIEFSQYRRYFRLALVFPFIAAIALSLCLKISIQPFQWISQGSFSRAYESPVLTDLAKRITDARKPERVLTFNLYTNILHS